MVLLHKVPISKLTVFSGISRQHMLSVFQSLCYSQLETCNNAHGPAGPTCIASTGRRVQTVQGAWTLLIPACRSSFIIIIFKDLRLFFIQYFCTAVCTEHYLSWTPDHFGLNITAEQNKPLGSRVWILIGSIIWEVNPRNTHSFFFRKTSGKSAEWEIAWSH